MGGVKPVRATGLRAERAEATRQRIADAGRRLFRQDGYAATTLKAVAVEAGVAPQTVYAVYGSKAGILRTLIEEAVHQPDAERAFASGMADPSAKRRIAAFARSIRLRWEATADIVAIAQDAALVDRGVRSGVDAALARRRAGIADLARSLDRALRRGMDVERASAILVALSMPELYAEVTEVFGWSADEYEAWLGSVLAAELLDPTG
jgi:AcrR family transcriptional regulator